MTLALSTRVMLIVVAVCLLSWATSASTTGSMRPTSC